MAKPTTTEEYAAMLNQNKDYFLGLAQQDYFAKTPPGLSDKDTSSKGFVEDFFFKLTTWPGVVPLQSFWVIVITFPKTLLAKVADYVAGYDHKPWTGYKTSIMETLISTLYQSSQTDDYMYGCFFARSINIPGEKIDTTTIEYNQQGLLFPSIVKSRATLTDVTVNFTETNDSFMDIVLRPWSILGGYLGAVARADGGVKGTMEALFYAKTDPQDSLVVRKSFTFHDIIPISINSQEYTQSGDALLVRPARFLYSSYTVKNNNIYSSTASSSAAAGAPKTAAALKNKGTSKFVDNMPSTANPNALLSNKFYNPKFGPPVGMGSSVPGTPNYKPSVKAK